MENEMAKTKNKALAEFVRRERKRRAWSQSKLAENAGVELRTIQRLEKDGITSFKTLIGIAKAFEMSITQLTSFAEKSEKEGPKTNVNLLPRLTSGKEITDIIGGTELFEFEHDSMLTKREVDFMVDFLEVLKSDVVKWHDADLIEKVKLSFELSQAIKDIEQVGFYLFGNRREVFRTFDGRRTKVKISTLFMSHSNSPKIVANKNMNMMVPAILSGDI